MRGRVLYVGCDASLAAYLNACAGGSFSLRQIVPARYRGEGADLLLWDLDDAPLSPEIPKGTPLKTVGYGKGCDVVRPFLFSDVGRLFGPDPAPTVPVLSGVSRELYSEGETVKLSPLEYDLLKVLFDAGEDPVEPGKLQSLRTPPLSLRALTVALSTLRGKLAGSSVPLRIESVRGRGYKLQF